MANQAPDRDARLLQLQSQLDRLSQLLQQSQHAQGPQQEREGQLSKLLQQGTEILDRLQATDTRQAEAVGELESRLGEWRKIESGFRDRAKSLDEMCEEAAQAVKGIKHAEARLAVLSSERETLAARPPVELAPPSVPAEGESWSLESVVRLHDELRQSSDDGSNLPAVRGDWTEALVGRVKSLEAAVNVSQGELARAASRHEQQRRRSTQALWLMALGAVTVGALGLVWQRSMDARLSARLNEATDRVTAAQREAETATRMANERVAAAQRAADQQIIEAQRTAQRAQLVSEVLSSSDLVRLGLVGGTRAPGASAQLSWSPSRGLVLSGSRVPAPPTGAKHRLWLLTAARPVDAGSFEPDSQGRVMLVTDKVQAPHEVTGAAVTVDPASGAPRRSSSTVRLRALIATPVPAEPAPAAENNVQAASSEAVPQTVAPVATPR
jgi:hypothetical protein